MDENVNAKLKRVIFLCILGVALIVLAICWTKIAINVTDPSDTASHITKRPLPTAASQAPLPDEDDETDVTPGPEITGEITPELTGEPTAEPTKGTETKPTAEPTKGTETGPTAEPTSGTETRPTAEPTKGTETSPTAEPTKGTETRPTAEPTKATAGTPTGTPTPLPTKAPTNTPTPTPTKAPTNTPTPVPTKAPTGNSSYYGKLKVVGANLTDSNGNPVQLRGMSTHGIGWFPDYVNKAAFSDLKNWGCNLIRLAMYTAEGGYCDGGNKTQLKKMVTDGVQYATELDMYVIIDWHILHDNDPTKYKSEAKTFFDEMSKKYADNPHVLYEICNEPNSGTSWATVKKYAEEIIPVIRKNSPDAIIIVGTPTWCQDIDQVVTNPIKNQTNIMYAVHFYADTHKEWLRNKVTDAYKAKIPVFISEFGICDASGNGNINEEEADKWIELLDKYSISYANWSFCNKAESASFLKSSCTKKSGFTESDLSQSGKWMVKTLAKYKNGVATPTKAPAATPAPTKAPAATSTPVPTSKPGSPTNTPVPTSTPVPTPTNTPTPVPTSIPTPVPTATPTPIPEVKLSDLIVSADGLTYKESSDGWTNEKGRVISFTVEIKNNGTTTITDWSRTIVLKPGTKAEIFGGWCANVKIEGESIIITPVDYNKTIQPGGSISNIGIQLQIIYE